MLVLNGLAMEMLHLLTHLTTPLVQSRLYQTSISVHYVLRNLCWVTMELPTLALQVYNLLFCLVLLEGVMETVVSPSLLKVSVVLTRIKTYSWLSIYLSLFLICMLILYHTHRRTTCVWRWWCTSCWWCYTLWRKSRNMFEQSTGKCMQ